MSKVVVNPFAEEAEEDIKNPFSDADSDGASSDSSQFVYPAEESDESETSFHYPSDDEPDAPPAHSSSPRSRFPNASVSQFPPATPQQDSFLELPAPSELSSHLNSLIQHSNLHSLERFFNPTTHEIDFWEQKYGRDWPGAFQIINDAANSRRTGGTILAASCGHLSVLRLLVDHGAILSISDQSGETALHKAIQNNHLDCVKFLLDNDGEVDQQDNDGWAGIHIASARGLLHIMELLMAHKSDLNLTSQVGYTPLMNAVAREQQDAVSLLIKFKVDPFVATSDGTTALGIACDVANNRLFEILSRYEESVFRQPLSRLPSRPAAYEPLSLHKSYRVLVYEYQQLDWASSIAGSPIFNHGALSKTRSPYAVPPSFPGINDTGKEIALVNLDTIGLPSDTSGLRYSSKGYLEQAEWVWVGHWQEYGQWEYASSPFRQDWTTTMPPINFRFLKVAKVIRRRRLVRFMRQKLDRSLLDSTIQEFGEPEVQLDARPVMSQLWEEDSTVVACRNCHVMFALLRRKHHCRICGKIVCGDCSRNQLDLWKESLTEKVTGVRVCDKCFKKYRD